MDRDGITVLPHTRKDFRYHYDRNLNLTITGSHSAPGAPMGRPRLASEGRTEPTTARDAASDQ